MKVLLGVSGSISAYKAYDLTREYIKDGHQVIVVLTAGAENFIKKETFRYLGAEEVYSAGDDFEKKFSGNVLHIDLARWCERFVIAPLSANTLAKISRGLSDDLLSSIFLSLKADIPVVLYPAMNPEMLHNHITQKNIDLLQERDLTFVYPPDGGEMICGEEGQGKLPTVKCIKETSLTWSPETSNSKTVLITTGATISPLDPIRYLTNSSSGITGFYLAQEFLKNGHKVILIAGEKSTEMLDYLEPFENFTLERVVTSSQMKEVVHRYFTDADFYISSAAISDIEFDDIHSKLKKDQLVDSLPIKRADDILASVLKIKNSSQKIIGFAAETHIGDKVLKTKWNQKPVDLLVGNTVSHGLQKDSTQKGFAVTEGDYTFFEAGKIIGQEKLSKKELAQNLYQWSLQ